MLVNSSGQWAIHCNQEILWNLNPLLRSLQIWIYYNLRNVSEPYLTKVDIIWMCLDACKLHSSTKWPIKPMLLNIHHFCKFLSITNLAWIIWVSLSRFHVNWCRTCWDIGNSSKTSQNRTFSIHALGTANCCKCLLNWGTGGVIMPRFPSIPYPGCCQIWMGAWDFGVFGISSVGTRVVAVCPRSDGEEYEGVMNQEWKG
jgi:hypothetical protein